MSTKKSKAPNHGVTGLSISQEEVDLFLDYLVESEPEQAKVHENAKETANTDIRDARSIISTQKRTDCIGFLIKSRFLLINTSIMR